MRIPPATHLSFLLTIIVAACTSAPETFPIGVYLDRNGGMVVFKDDGTYEVSDNQDADPVIFGEYVIDGDMITMKDNLFYCPDEVGVYRWLVNRDRSITLEVIDEECTRREQILVDGLTFLRP